MDFNYIKNSKIINDKPSYSLDLSEIEKCYNGRVILNITNTNYSLKEECQNVLQNVSLFLGECNAVMLQLKKSMPNEVNIINNKPLGLQRVVLMLYQKLEIKIEELLLLLNNGYCEGSFLQYRCILETIAIALFLYHKFDTDQQIVERFVEYGNIEKYHKNNHIHLSEQLYSLENNIIKDSDLSIKVDELKSKFGDHFVDRKTFGWCDNNKKERYSMDVQEGKKSILEEVGLLGFYPMYIKSSQEVHLSTLSIFEAENYRIHDIKNYYPVLISSVHHLWQATSLLLLLQEANKHQFQKLEYVKDRILDLIAKK